MSSVNDQVMSTMDFIGEYGNTSEETRSATIKGMSTLALAMAFDKLADAVKSAAGGVQSGSIPMRSSAPAPVASNNKATQVLSDDPNNPFS